MLQKLLGRRIAHLRRAKGLSQEDLAATSRYSVEFISLIERGVNAPSLAGLEKIAKALKVQVQELFNFGRPPRRGGL